MAKNEETLLKFLEGLNEKIAKQDKGTLAIGSMLTDLVDELSQIVKGMHVKAIKLSAECRIKLDEMSVAVSERDTVMYDKASQEVFELKGMITAYLDMAEQLSTMGERVGRRPYETKH